MAPVHSDAEIETVITSLGREPGGGLVVDAGCFHGHPPRANHIAGSPKQCTCGLSSSASLPETAVCFPTEQTSEIYFAAPRAYVDRILRGAKPSDLPVQMPVKYLMIVNLQTAKALGLTVPPSMLLAPTR